MAVLSFEELKEATEVYLSAWTSPTVKDEPLIPTSPDGDVWVSFWDNWLLPPRPWSIDPLITMNGFALEDVTNYNIIQAGDNIRGKIQLTTGAGGDAVVLATYRRAMFTSLFWQANMRQAISEITQRLLLSMKSNTELKLDDETDPWHIIVKEAAKNALINLQTMMAGLGKVQYESVIVDLSRAHNMIHEVIDDLEGDIDRDVVAWRHYHSPPPRQALAPTRGPWFYGTWPANMRAS